MSKLGAYARLMRPVNCLMTGLAVIVGATLADLQATSVFELSLLYGFVTGFMMSAASMSINDYYDREIDAINEPDRPIPSGAVEPKEVLAFAFTLAAIGFVAALLTNFPCLIIAIIAWIVSVTYTTVGKRSGLSGNFLVSICISIPFVYGSYAVSGAIKLNVLIFASMAFLSVTGREITKGIVDVKGDKTQNVKTLAVRYGEKTAAFVAAFFYLFAVLMSPIPWFLNSVSFWFIPLVAVTDVGLIASSFLIIKDYSRETARKVKNTVLLWFTIGLIAFLVGAIR